MGTIGYHEPTGELTGKTRSIHRALSTVMEELEAVDWYQQRADATTDESLKAILLHNRDEEIEHAAMGLEWLRRQMPQFDEIFRTYLFTDAPIVAIEEASGDGEPETSTAAKGRGTADDSDLGIRDLDAGE